jgi:hypothetical protein
MGFFPKVHIEFGRTHNRYDLLLSGVSSFAAMATIIRNIRTYENVIILSGT